MGGDERGRGGKGEGEGCGRSVRVCRDYLYNRHTRTHSDVRLLRSKRHTQRNG